MGKNRVTRRKTTAVRDLMIKEKALLPTRSKRRNWWNTLEIKSNKKIELHVRLSFMALYGECFLKSTTCAKHALLISIKNLCSLFPKHRGFQGYSLRDQLVKMVPHRHTYILSSLSLLCICINNVSNYIEKSLYFQIGDFNVKENFHTWVASYVYSVPTFKILYQP